MPRSRHRTKNEDRSREDSKNSSSRRHGSDSRRSQKQSSGKPDIYPWQEDRRENLKGRSRSRSPHRRMKSLEDGPTNRRGMGLDDSRFDRRRSLEREREFQRRVQIEFNDNASFGNQRGNSDRMDLNYDSCFQMEGMLNPQRKNRDCADLDSFPRDSPRDGYDNFAQRIDDSQRIRSTDPFTRPSPGNFQERNIDPPLLNPPAFWRNDVPEDFRRQTNDVPDEFRRQITDVPGEFRRQLNDVPDDFRRQTNDFPDEFRRQRNDFQDDFRRQTTDVPGEFRRQINDVPDDFRRQRNDFPDDFRRQTNDFPDDFRRQTNDFPDDFRRQTNDVPDEFRRQINDVPGELRRQLNDVPDEFRRQGNDVPDDFRRQRTDVPDDFCRQRNDVQDEFRDQRDDGPDDFRRQRNDVPDDFRRQRNDVPDDFRRQRNDVPDGFSANPDLFELLRAKRARFDSSFDNARDPSTPKVFEPQYKLQNNNMPMNFDDRGDFNDRRINMPVNIGDQQINDWGDLKRSMKSGDKSARGDFGDKINNMPMNFGGQRDDREGFSDRMNNMSNSFGGREGFSRGVNNIPLNTGSERNDRVDRMNVGDRLFSGTIPFNSGDQRDGPNDFNRNNTSQRNDRGNFSSSLDYIPFNTGDRCSDRVDFNTMSSGDQRIGRGNLDERMPVNYSDQKGNRGNFDERMSMHFGDQRNDSGGFNKMNSSEQRSDRGNFNRMDNMSMNFGEQSNSLENLGGNLNLSDRRNIRGDFSDKINSSQFHEGRARNDNVFLSRNRDQFPENFNSERSDFTFQGSNHDNDRSDISRNQHVDSRGFRNTPCDSDIRSMNRDFGMSQPELKNNQGSGMNDFIGFNVVGNSDTSALTRGSHGALDYVNSSQRLIGHTNLININRQPSFGSNKSSLQKTNNSRSFEEGMSRSQSNEFQNRDSQSLITLEDVKNHMGPYGFLVVFYLCEEHPHNTLSKTASLFKRKYSEQFSFNETSKIWFGRVLLDGKVVYEGSDEHEYVCKLNVSKGALDKLRSLYYTILVFRNFGTGMTINESDVNISRPIQSGGNFKLSEEQKLRNVIVEYKENVREINDLYLSVKETKTQNLELFAIQFGLTTEKIKSNGEKYLVLSKKNCVMELVYNLVEISPSYPAGNKKYKLLRPGQSLSSCGLPLNKIEFQPKQRKMKRVENQSAQKQ